MENNTISFAVITYYPKWYKGKLQSISHTDKVRGDLALQFIEKTIADGYQIVVVDGHSSRSFRQELAAFQSIKTINRRGYRRSPSKRQAYNAASKLPHVKVIITTEAEKVSLIDFAHTIAKPLLDESADIVIIKREEKLFKSSYPDYMYGSEIEGNRLYNEQLKTSSLLASSADDYDMFFGPRAFRNEKKVVALFMRRFHFVIDNHIFPEQYFDPEELSNASFFPIVMALKKGFRVKSVQIPFVYPKLQKENETVGSRELFFEKRRAQRLGLLVELMHLLQSFKKKK